MKRTFNQFTVPLINFAVPLIKLIDNNWSEAEFKELSCGLNLSRSSNMVSST